MGREVNMDHLRSGDGSSAGVPSAGGKDEVSNYQWLSVEQHRLKTKIDVLRCRMMKKEAK